MTPPTTTKHGGAATARPAISTSQAVGGRQRVRAARIAARAVGLGGLKQGVHCRGCVIANAAGRRVHGQIQTRRTREGGREGGGGRGVNQPGVHADKLLLLPVQGAIARKRRVEPCKRRMLKLALEGEEVTADLLCVAGGSAVGGEEVYTFRWGAADSGGAAPGCGGPVADPIADGPFEGEPARTHDQLRHHPATCRRVEILRQLRADKFCNGPGDARVGACCAGGGARRAEGRGRSWKAVERAVEGHGRPWKGPWKAMEGRGKGRGRSWEAIRRGRSAEIAHTLMEESAESG